MNEQESGIGFEDGQTLLLSESGIVLCKRVGTTLQPYSILNNFINPFRHSISLRILVPRHPTCLRILAPAAFFGHHAMS